jgi:SAM-dependent methyltransferase
MGNAKEWIEHEALALCGGTGLDIGCGQWPLPGAVGIDNWPCVNAYRLDFVKDGSLDYVFSSHCLEHLERPLDAMRLWAEKLKPGGVMFLYLPHPTMGVWNPESDEYDPGAEHVWTPTYEAVAEMMHQCGLRRVRGSRDADGYWSFYIVGEKPDA